MRQVIDLITMLLMLINLANLPYKNGNCCALVKKIVVNMSFLLL